MPTSHPLPPKKDVALALLERSSIHIHLDPRHAQVIVPPWFKRQPQLVLQLGLNMPVPIPDLHLDDDGLRCTLSFNRAPFFCVVSWSSIFAIVGDDGCGMVWPDDVPAEVVTRQAPQTPARLVETPARSPAAAKAAAVREPRSEAEAPPKRPRKRRALSAVSEGANGQREAKSSRASVEGSRDVPSSETPTAELRPLIRSTRRKRELPPYLRIVK